MHHEDLYVISDFFPLAHKHSPAVLINVIVLQINTQQTISQQSNVQCQVQRETQWDSTILHNNTQQNGRWAFFLYACAWQGATISVTASDKTPAQQTLLFKFYTNQNDWIEWFLGPILWWNPMWSINFFTHNFSSYLQLGSIYYLTHNNGRKCYT